MRSTHVNLERCKKTETFPSYTRTFSAHLFDMSSHGRYVRNQMRVAMTAAELAFEKRVDRKKQSIIEEVP